MKKNNVSNIVKVLSFSFVFCFLIGVSFVHAQTPPSGNVPGPLNTGPSTQDKAGSLHITAGGFRSWGPALFDDIVIIGYVSGGSQSQSQTGYLQKNKKEVGFFTKLSKFFGLNTEKALAGISDPVTGGPVIPPNGFPPSCGYSNGQSFATAPTTSLCDVGIHTIVVGSGPNTGYWKWNCDDANSFYPSAICSANKTGGTGPIGVPLDPTGLITTLYRLTVNGNTNISSNALIGGDTQITSLAGTGIRQVCIDASGKLIICQ